MVIRKTSLTITGRERPSIAYHFHTNAGLDVNIRMYNVRALIWYATLNRNMTIHG